MTPFSSTSTPTTPPPLQPTPTLATSTSAPTTAATTGVRQLELVPEETWRAAAAAHRERVRRLVGGSLGGRSDKGKGQPATDPTNPIYNFLFNYYFWKPSQVAAYSPGLRRVLLNASLAEMPRSGTQRRALPFLRCEDDACEPSSAAAAAAAATAAAAAAATAPATATADDDADAADDTLTLITAEGSAASSSSSSSALTAPPALGFYFDASATCSVGTLLGFEATLSLLQATQERPPSFSCYGLHEWAMLYAPPTAATIEDRGSGEGGKSGGSERKRHQSLPLRLSQAALNEAVEAAGLIRCTHYDAFRFFTPEAVPLNFLPPSELGQSKANNPNPASNTDDDDDGHGSKKRKNEEDHRNAAAVSAAAATTATTAAAAAVTAAATAESSRRKEDGRGLGGPGRAVAQLKHEQPGCVHATMDLFKWAMKLHPFASSELVADCLALARDARLVDMRASPYDLTQLTPSQRRRWDDDDQIEADDVERDDDDDDDGQEKAAAAGGGGGGGGGEEAREGGNGGACGRCHGRHLSSYFDVSPIRVESPEGRAEYQRLQEALYRRALPLRRRLIDEYRAALSHVVALSEQQQCS